MCGCMPLFFLSGFAVMGGLIIIYWGQLDTDYTQDVTGRPREHSVFNMKI